MKGWGVWYISVGLLAGYSSLLGMMATVNGAPESVWPALSLAASILLFCDGLKCCFSQIANWSLVVIVAAIPLCLCSIFMEWPLPCWIFSGALAVVEMLLLRVSNQLKRDGIIPFVSGVILGLALTDSTVRLFLHYWSDWWNAKSQWGITDIVGFILPAFIPGAALLSIVVHSGIEVFGHRKQRKAVSGSDPNPA